MNSQLLCIRQKDSSAKCRYIRVPSGTPLADVLGAIALNLSPDNEPYQSPLYTDRYARWGEAVRAAGFDVADEEVGDITIDDLARSMSSGSCGVPHVSIDNKAALLKLVDLLSTKEVS